MKEHTHQSSGEIHHDIKQTRQRMDKTIDRLTDRMQPRHLLDEFLHFVRTKTKSRAQKAKQKVEEAASHARDAGSSAARTVAREARDNAIPAALLVAGVGWWIWNRKNAELNARSHDGRNLNEFERESISDASVGS
jgi:hypothetical protein